MTKQKYLKKGKHFLILDGLRGVAAIAIVIFHFMEWIYEPKDNFIAHAFLAVDFFFCLSGFVLGYAYDGKVSKMGLKQFFVRRLIRLQPMVVFGAVIGLIAFLIDPFATYQFTYSYGKIILLFICAFLLVPLPIMKERSFNNFGLNAPAWSLFWEYVANILYALILSKLPKKFLLYILIPAAVALVYINYSEGHLLGGWAGANFWQGGVRIAYSFTAGLIIYRYNLILKNYLGFLWLTVFLSLVFLSPHLFERDLLESFMVIFLFPLFISLGAGSPIEKKAKRICKFSGAISYPLYMTHYAFMWIYGNYFMKHQPDSKTLSTIIILGTLGTILFAWLVMKCYELPIRKFFTKQSKKRFKARNKKRP